MKQATALFGITLVLIAITLIILPLINISKTTSEPYSIPRSSVLISESFSVSPNIVTHTGQLIAGDSIKIQVTVTSGGNRDIDFSINDGSTTYVSYSRATTINKDWIVPSTSNYNFVYDNSFSWITSKDVSVQVTKYWTEIGYRDVTTYTPLLPLPVVYAGILLAVLGGLLVVYTLITSINKKHELKNNRVCSQCNQTVSIDRSICPYCGFDVTKSTRCKHCNSLYSSSEYRCPHCGAKRQ